MKFVVVSQVALPLQQLQLLQPQRLVVELQPQQPPPQPQQPQQQLGQSVVLKTSKHVRVGVELHGIVLTPCKVKVALMELAQVLLQKLSISVKIHPLHLLNAAVMDLMHAMKTARLMDFLEESVKLHAMLVKVV